MTLRVERSEEGRKPVFQVSGRIGAETLGELQAAIDGARDCALDLRHVTLVDVEGVQFLLGCERRGMELRHCSPFVREWMLREQQG